MQFPAVSALLRTLITVSKEHHPSLCMMKDGVIDVGSILLDRYVVVDA